MTKKFLFLGVIIILLCNPVVAESAWSDNFDDNNLDGWTFTVLNQNSSGHFLTGGMSGMEVKEGKLAFNRLSGGNWAHLEIVEHPSTAIEGTWSFDLEGDTGVDNINFMFSYANEGKFNETDSFFEFDAIGYTLEIGLNAWGLGLNFLEYVPQSDYPGDVSHEQVQYEEITEEEIKGLHHYDISVQQSTTAVKVRLFLDDVEVIQFLDLSPPESPELFSIMSWEGKSKYDNVAYNPTPKVSGSINEPESTEEESPVSLNIFFISLISLVIFKKRH